MPVRVEVSRVLPLPPERLWSLLVRWEEQPAWMLDADRVRVLTSAREGMGVRVGVRTRVLRVPLFTEVLEVTGWDPPHRLEIAHRSFVRGVGTWSLEPEGASTRFSWTEEVWLPVPLVGALALLVYRPLLRRVMGRSLAGLQRLITST